MRPWTQPVRGANGQTFADLPCLPRLASKSGVDPHKGKEVPRGPGLDDCGPEPAVPN